MPPEQVEEGSVMIDEKAEAASSGRLSGGESEPAAAHANDAGVIPASYGQLKGTLADGGANILVFENEDGVISFVQVLVGKKSVTCRLIDKVLRSAD